MARGSLLLVKRWRKSRDGENLPAGCALASLSGKFVLDFELLAARAGNDNRHHTPPNNAAERITI
jgi:hypothetical protein